MLNKLFRRRRRRTTFLRLFLTGMILPVLITLVLGAVMSYYIRMNAFRAADRAMTNAIDWYYQRKTVYDPEGQKKMPDSVALLFRSYISLDEEGGILYPGTWIEPDYKTAVVTFDADGRVLDNNRRKLMTCVRWSMEPEPVSRFYSYDPQEHDIPELNELFDMYAADVRQDSGCCYSYKFESLYLNEETGKMVPHVMQVTKSRGVKLFLNYENFFIGKSEDEEPFTITVDFAQEGYVLHEMHNDENDVFPRSSMSGIIGCDPDKYDAVAGKCTEKIRQSLERDKGEMEYGGDYRKQQSVAIVRLIRSEDGVAGICAYTETDVTGLAVWRRLIFMLGLLFTAMTLFVLAVCLIKNAKNKAQYAFEDYQRALTNNLAHDLKTPLAVIGGYAENLIQMRQESAGEKELDYLRSIMKNVAYTDEIIRKTLQFSEAGQFRKLNKTEVDVRKLTEQLAEKYRTALTERGIELRIEGESKVQADADLLTVTLENLLSNAVKYTVDGGLINAQIAPARFILLNDISEDMRKGFNAKKLMMPFVRGDKARNDKTGSGLGLPMAKAAAEQNGFTLRIGFVGKPMFAAELLFFRSIFLRS